IEPATVRLDGTLYCVGGSTDERREQRCVRFALVAGGQAQRSAREFVAHRACTRHCAQIASCSTDVAIDDAEVACLEIDVERNRAPVVHALRMAAECQVI